jgi:hypothetical protein
MRMGITTIATSRRLRRMLLAGAAATALLSQAACGGDDKADKPGQGGTNHTPSISGSPATSVVASASYSFQPSASDADGDTLTFAIQNAPSWATFSATTGQMSGTPDSDNVGTYGSISISVSDGEASASLPPFSISVRSSASSPPVISGLPLTNANAGSLYLFAPTASDPDGSPLTFSIANLPAWASFSTTDGRLTGTPGSSDIGIYAGIAIHVTDGTTTVSLPSFTITVSAAQTPPSGTPYPGYTYTLPTIRPFISLDHYSRADRTSNAYTRLKAQVDDVVTVTNRFASSGTYSQLVSALNADHYGYSPVDSVIMFRISGDTAYIDQAIRMVDLFVQAENAAIAAGEIPLSARDSYLEVGLYISELALTYDYGYSRLTAAQRSAWSAYAEQAIYNIWNYESASWGKVSRPWSGWSVRDPGNNYFYGFMKATQLWALASQNPTWIAYLQSNVYSLLVPFFSVLNGGGSREGTGYGTALGNLFENYLYWKGSTGEDLAAYSSHARETIDYWIHATVPTFQYFASIGDQSRVSMPIMFDYQRKLVLTGVALYPDTNQGKRGNWWLNRVQVTDGGTGWLSGQMRYNYDFKYDLLGATSSEQAPIALTYDATGVGALFSRSDWTTTASWIHTNAGNYDQSHAHEDQGSFSFFKNRWLTITSNTLSNSGINQGVGVHNVVRFDFGGAAIPQTESVSTKTVSDSADVLQVSENLSPAYSNSAGRVSSWVRELTYTRSSHNLRIHDVCSIAAGVTAVFQLHTPVQPVRQPDGSYLAGNLRVTPVLPVSPTVNIVSMRDESSDFSDGYRLELRGPASNCEFIVSLAAQ